MPAPAPWFERRWRFDAPVGVHPDLIARLAGAPARVDELARMTDWNSALLTRRDGDTWSIQENMAHLIDLEALFFGRLDDFDAGAPELRAADVTNAATHRARHNERDIGDVLSLFRRVRAATVARLDALPPESFARTSNHPRLKTPMRLVDHLLFWADHDDYHLARIRELLRRFATS